MRRVLAIGCLVPVGIFVLTLVLVGGWQVFESNFNPAVQAIHRHSVATTATVQEIEIDGFGGDPAVSYRYNVAGRTYQGHDIASAATGDVLVKNPGDPIPIQYAASMPAVSCVAQSMDCPNDVFAPGFYVAVFEGLMLLTAIMVGVTFGVRAVIRRLADRGRHSKVVAHN